MECGWEMKKILDATCGSRSIWFNKEHPAALYMDKREEHHEARYGSNDSLRTIDVKPDVVADFTKMPFEDNTFSLVVFDPPPPAKNDRVVAYEEVWAAGQ